MFKHIFVKVLVFMGPLSTFAQLPARHYYAHWFTYFAQYRLSQTWGIHADIQFRTDQHIHQTNQSLIRLGLQRLLSPMTNLTLGYALVGTYSRNTGGYFGEHRLWQQYLHTARIGSRSTMTHRLRLEERWVGYADGRNGRRYGFRLRYFNRTIIPLSLKVSDRSDSYLALQDELFLNSAARDINPNLFDQNRLLIAVGLLYNGHTRLEVGYMNQYINPPENTKIVNHILHLSILQSLDFSSMISPNSN